MSKTKKIISAVVSIVMAGTMSVSFAACGPDKKPSGGGGELTDSQTRLELSTDENGKLTWADGTELNMNMGQSSSVHLAFSQDNIPSGMTATLLDGKQYGTNSLKPAWQALSDELGIGIRDSYNDEGSSATRVNNLINANKLGDYAMVNGTSTQIVNAGSGSQAFLDLRMYLDYMPDFKKFLEDNPVTYMSLTSQTDTGAIYYAPYYDGNDDIEKYEIINKHWVTALLDGAAGAGDSTTFKASVDGKAALQGGPVVSTESSVESFMGTKGEWSIDSSNPADEGATTVRITVSYDDALAAAKESGSALNKALTAAGVDTASLDSGNIVDMQNAAIDAKKGEVTGVQLLDILKAYIDVAYQDGSGAKYYDTRSDVFNGYDAAWDVDLLVGLMRALVTNTNLLPDYNLRGSNLVFGLEGRQGNMQRQRDIMSLAGELYGVRGFYSVYEYTYIDEDGVIHDARQNAASFDAMNKLNAMAKEGLLYTGTTQKADETSYYTSATAPVSMMIYDYVQTQTSKGGFVMQGITTNNNVPAGYDFSPINTPVSKWNDGDTSTGANADGITYSYDGEYKYMRFSESWRTVKNTGFGIPYDYVAKSPDRLSACLAIINYMFSNDGQILMSYGPMGENNDISGDRTSGFTADNKGWWVGEEYTAKSIDEVAYKPEGSDQYYVKPEYAAECFAYQNKLYTGVYYKGQQQPQLTTATLELFYGYSVNGLQVGKEATDANPIGNIGVNLSYTNFARNIIGSAQPMGNKLQSFEYQCSAEIGIEGADLVASGLVNGTISHLYVSPDNAKGMWYFVVPTTLPYSSTDASYINDNFDTLTQQVYTREKDATTNFFWDIVKAGYGTEAVTGVSFQYGDRQMGRPKDGADAVAKSNVEGLAANVFEAMMQAAFEDIMDYYNEYIKAAE